MKKLLLGLLLLFSSLGFAAITMQLESSIVNEGEPFRLVLTLDGSQTGRLPDLTPLQNDFIILGTQRSMNYSVTNGQAQAVNQWLILLMPKRVGMLTIPSIQIGQEKTTAASIEVRGRAAKPRQSGMASQEVMLAAEVNEASPYVNQQVIYTVKLYSSRRLVDAEYQAPQVEDALLIPLGSGNHYQRVENGRVYTVDEQQYALFPQKSGELKIKPPIFQALVYDVFSKRVKVQANPVSLKVKAMPAQFSAARWLPAKQVSLSEAYEDNSLSFKQGSTLVRTVSLQAVAVPAQLLPRLDFAVNHSDFSVYPENPSEKNTIRQGDLIGTTTMKLTYLLDKPGQITIPALKLTWFNTLTGKEERSELPERTLHVTAVSTGGQASSSPASVKSEKVLGDSDLVDGNKREASLPQGDESSMFAWWLAGGFALAWLLTLGLWLQRRPQHSPSPKSRPIVKRLQQACLGNNPRDARDALIQWARLQWPQANVLNLMDIEKIIDDEPLKQQITLLFQALYHNERQTSWHGEALWRCIVSFTPPKSAAAKMPLPPIHKL
ncbi:MULTISPECIES: BatD family protein [unclassified Legionella]|uniref:BatD family protein n=1 Tax=unclassified Legionella TaxID=2622702 RepID=UPI0013EF9F38|nr:MULTISPECIES: BatD family protein [unclassified Legionella]MDI9819650.1 BatD family protein [Legionella sp. PL877]